MNGRHILLTALLLTTNFALCAESNTAVVTEWAMKIADKDKEGKLTLEESKPLDVQTLHHGKEHFERGDANKDGFLNHDEFTAHAEAKLNSAAIPKKRKEKG